MVCGIWFPDQGSNPSPPALGMKSLSHWITREVPRELSNSSRCVCVWISALRNTLGSGREGSSHVLEQPSALNIHPCVPLSLQVFFVIAQAWVPSSGQRTMNRCDVSHVWTKVAWSWGAFFSSLFPTGVTWVKRHQNYKMRGLVWPGWDFVFIEKWVFLLPQHSLALPD